MFFYSNTIALTIALTYSIELCMNVRIVHFKFGMIHPVRFSLDILKRTGVGIDLIKSPKFRLIPKTEKLNCFPLCLRSLCFHVENDDSLPTVERDDFSFRQKKINMAAINNNKTNTRKALNTHTHH